ncbi:MAG: hypothetical protein K2Y37_04520 [Pirellulales bacterium]|nr:hypothetical protein [Pirellulales bacterium]
MSIRVVFTVALLCWLAGLIGSPRSIAAPWDRLMPSSRPEADPNKSYELSERNGPWTILAVTFSGEDATNQANDLVLELRKRYKLPAYTHKMSFDFTDIEGRSVNRYGVPKKMKYQRGKVLEEIAVLVGDYPAVDDAAAQRDLRQLWHLRPECLEIKGDRKVSRPLAAMRLVQRQVQSGFLGEGRGTYLQNIKQDRGAMGNAFVTTNPLLPREYFVPNGVDPLVAELNAPAKYTLLKCPGKYSVRVATFNGGAIIDQQRPGQLKAEDDPDKISVPNRLAAGAKRAHLLTEALRARGFEAYEFHDRTMSCVCVGSFAEAGHPRGDGTVDWIPEVDKIIATFGVPMPGAGAAPGAGSNPAKTLIDIPPKPPGKLPRELLEMAFDPEPRPIEVPRRSLAGDYDRSSADYR